MMKIFTSALFIFLSSVFAQAQTSANLFGAQVWLRADAGSMSSTSWKDVSGNNRDATIFFPEEAPSNDGSLNFHKAILFDGINDYLKIPYSLEGLSEITVIAVFQSADTTERGVWGAENPVLRNTLLTTRRAKGPESEMDHYGNHERVAVINTMAQNWTKTGSSESLATGEDIFVALGSAGKESTYKPFKGAVSELMIFNRMLTFLERAQVETYLAIRYGIALQNSNYVSSKENLLWHTENNRAYANRIAGIGRDDAFGLYQKQSRSAYDTSFLIMSVGPLANSNEENKSPINNQDFLIWGDNNLPLTARKSEGTDSLLSFIERKWILQASGTTTSQLPAELYINIKALPFSTLGYWLAIDRSGTGNFDRDNLEYIRPRPVGAEHAGKVMIFENVKWDTDRSGKDMFALVQGKNFYALVRTLESPLCDKRDGGKIAVEILGGRAPYRYDLKNTKQNYSKSWQGTSLREELSSLPAGEYVLTVRNADNEKIVRNFTLSWADALKIDLGPDQKVEGNQLITLDASTFIPATSNVVYLWESNNGFASTEAKIEVSEHGLYRVLVTNEKGCVFSDEIALSGDEHRFDVFPTVVHDEKFSIGISLQEPGAVNVKIINSSGRVLQEINGSDSSEYLFTGYAKDPGMYLVVLQTPEGIETRKVIVY